MLIAQKLASLLNGVSQKPAAARPSSQAELQENCLSHRIHGLRRRPPTHHIAKLGSIIADGGGLPLLPVGQLADFDADLGVSASAASHNSTTYAGVNSVINQVLGGGPLNFVTGHPAAYLVGATRLNGHSIIRCINDGDASEYNSAVAASGLAAFTLMVVTRTQASGSHSYPYALKASSGSYIMGLGNNNGAQEIAGFRTGGALGETGELSSGSGGEYVDCGAVFSGSVPSDGWYDRIGTEALGGPFDIITVRWPVAGKIQFIKNGFLLSRQFTMSGTFNLSNLIVTSASGGSLDAAGAKFWDWTRILLYPRCFSDPEVHDANHALGGKYGITVAP